jgi:hypothetical protein
MSPRLALRAGPLSAIPLPGTLASMLNGICLPAEVACSAMASAESASPIQYASGLGVPVGASQYCRR